MASRPVRVLAIAVVVGNLTTGCDGSARGSDATPITASTIGTPATSTTPPTSPAGGGLDWTTCADPTLNGGQCATLTVPIDYHERGGPSIEVFVYREAADGPRQGVLIVNPGGPGASAVDFVRDRSGTFPAGLDIIGFDPRGVGRSHQVHCIDNETMNAVFTGPLAPADPAELDEWLVDAQRSAATCLATDVGPFLGTVNVARDLEHLRLALGEEQINYLGFSYGARLGWTYAAMFPDHLRAMVLDGPEDPDADIATTFERQALEFEHLADEYNDACPRTPGAVCPDDIRTAASHIIERAERTPIPTRTGLPPLSAQYAINAVLSAFYDPNTWPDLNDAIRTAETYDGLPLARLSYWWNQNQTPDPGGVIDAIDLIWCADNTDRPTVEDYRRIAEQLAVTSPTFAAWYPGVIPRCHGYPPAAEPTPSPPSTTSFPTLVVSSTDDFATPLAGARDLVSRLGHATLLVRNGPGHTSYGLGYPCVDDQVDQFFAGAALPPPNTTCE